MRGKATEPCIDGWGTVELGGCTDIPLGHKGGVEEVGRQTGGMLGVGSRPGRAVIVGGGFPWPGGPKKGLGGGGRCVLVVVCV